MKGLYYTLSSTCRRIPHVIIIVAMTLGGCLTHHSSDDNCTFPIIESNISSNIIVKSARCFNLNPSFDYPRHSYFLLVGPQKELLAFVYRLRLHQITNSLVEITNETLNEYSDRKLWAFKGYYMTQTDTVIREKFDIKNGTSYAAYLHSGKPNRTFLSPRSNWNGKIVACLEQDTCILFIEELKSPLFQRNS